MNAKVLSFRGHLIFLCFFFSFILLEYLKKKPLKREVSEAYKRLKSTVDKCLSASGYSEVNLGKLFTVSIGRSVGESNNERQWLIKNGGRQEASSLFNSNDLLSNTLFQYAQWGFNNLVSLEEEERMMKMGCTIHVDMKFSSCFYLPFFSSLRNQGY